MTPNGSSSSPTLFLAPIVHSLSRETLEILPRALICVRDGIIDWVVPVSPDSSAEGIARDRGVDWSTASKVIIDEGFFCPGLIDTHTHAPQYPNNGLGYDLQLLDWLEALTFPLEEKFVDEEFAQRVYSQVVQRNLASGTTTACYYGTLHANTSVLADTCLSSGQRAFVGRCCMDTGHATYVEESTEASMAATHAFLDHFDSYTPSESELVKPILTPRFALSCTSTLMADLGALAAERDLAVQTHISENTTEIELVKKEFNSDTYAGVYASRGLLRRGTILAHAVHLNDAETEIIKTSGAGIAHCPGSNVNLNSGAARVLEMMDAGIPVGLGSDCSGGARIGILATLRDTATTARILAFEGKASRGLTIPELFYLATLGGARVCRLDDKLGSFLPGYQFDALWIRPSQIWVQEQDTVEQIFQKWLFNGDDRDIAAVWVRGRRVAGAEK